MSEMKRIRNVGARKVDRHASELHASVQILDGHGARIATQRPTHQVQRIDLDLVTLLRRVDPRAPNPALVARVNVNVLDPNQRAQAVG